MIKIQNINNRELKKELDNYFEVNLMISKIPEIKEKLIEFSYNKILNMLPNLEIINNNFKFKPDEELSFKPNILKDKFIEDYELEIREILVEYITDYSYYEKHKNKIMNDYIMLYLLNDYQINRYLLIFKEKNISENLEFQVNKLLIDDYQIKIKEPYDLSNINFNNIKNIQKKMVFNKNINYLKKIEILFQNNYYFSFNVFQYILYGSFDMSNNDLFDICYSHNYSKERSNFFDDIKIEDFNNFKITNEELLLNIINNIDKFIKKHEIFFKDGLLEYENNKEQFINNMIKYLFKNKDLFLENQNYEEDYQKIIKSENEIQYRQISDIKYNLNIEDNYDTGNIFD